MIKDIKRVSVSEEEIEKIVKRLGEQNETYRINYSTCVQCYKHN